MNLKQVKEMTNQELRFKVAELAGWERGPQKDITIKGVGTIASAMNCWHPKGEKENWQDNPPDFPDDLNAIHEAEMSLDPRIRLTIAQLLKYDVFATARQRAEAFVMVMGEQ